MPKDAVFSTGQQVAARRIAFNAVALAISGVFIHVAFVIVEAIIARRLGQESYGIFSSVFVLSSTALVFIDFGQSWKIIQDGSKDKRLLPEYLGAALLFRVVALTASYPLFLSVLDLIGYDERIASFFKIFFGYTIMMSIGEILASVDAAKQRLYVGAAYQSIVPVAILLLILIILPSEENLTGVAMAYVFGASGVVVVWAAAVLKSQRPRWMRMSLRIGMLRESLVLWMTANVSQLFVKSGLLVLPLMVNVSHVGVYAAAYKVIDVGSKIPLIVMRAFAPAMFLERNNGSGGYSNICNIILRAVTVSGVVSGTSLFVYADAVVKAIFGDEYAGATTALRVLSAGLMLRFVNVGLETVLMTSEKHALRGVGFMVATVINVVGTVLLILLVGPIGAAVCTVASESVLLSLFLIYVKKEVGITGIGSLLFGPIAVGVTGVIVVNALPFEPFAKLLLLLVSYVAMMLLTGYVRISEIQFICRSVGSRAGASVA